MSQNVINFVSLVAALIGSPEVLIAIIFSLAGWIGHGVWSERRRKRKKSERIDTSAATGLSASIPKAEVASSSSDESINSENEGSHLSTSYTEQGSVQEDSPEFGTISPCRVADELMRPALRELTACIDEAKRNRWNCRGNIIWKGTESNMETWWNEFHDLKEFPGDETVGDSIMMQISISVYLESISIPPVLKILEWNGYFRAGESGIDGSWEWRVDEFGVQKNVISAYDLNSLMKSFRHRIRGAMKWRKTVLPQLFRIIP